MRQGWTPTVTVSASDLRRGRRRLIASLILVAVAFSAFAAALGFLGSDATEILRSLPAAGRLGLLALTAALGALVWARHEELERLATELEHQETLIASLKSRLAALETTARMGAADDRAMDEALQAFLGVAIDMTGATGGSVEIYAAGGTRVASLADKIEGPSVSVPLTAAGRSIGDLRLQMPSGRSLTPPARAAVVDLGTQATTTLTRVAELSQKRRARTQEKMAAALKSRLLSSFSHELRTPLTSIIGYAATLDRHWARLEPSQQRDFVKAIRHQAARLAGLVERILEAARVEVEGASVRPVQHDVRFSVQGALTPFLAAAPGRISVVVPDVALESWIDPFVVDQVVSNLVDNALRYTQGKVSVSLGGTSRGVTIAVEDEGPWTVPEHGEGIDDGLVAAETGIGLGLHIVRTLVTDHGGTFSIEHGSTATRAIVRLAPLPVDEPH